MSCPVCCQGRPERAFEKQGLEILECPTCGVRFWIPGPDFEPRAIYGTGYFDDPAAMEGYDDYAGMEQALRATFRRRLRWLPPPEPGLLMLDAGAALGYAVDEARRAGWKAVAAEISESAAARAAAILDRGLAVADCQILPFAAGTFDAMTLWDVLEHLPEPHLAMAEAARFLRPGGRLALTTGDVGSLVARVSGRRWHLYNFPEHLFFYSRRGLTTLLERHGFRVERMAARSSVYPLGYLVERLRKTLLGRSAEGQREWRGAAGIGIPANLFDVVTVVAQRRPWAE